MSRADRDILDGFLSDDNPPALDRLRFSPRVGELLRLPGAAERWAQRVQESFRESRHRIELNRAWHQRRSAYFRPSLHSGHQKTKPPRGWVQARARLDEGPIVVEWVPPKYADSQEPYIFGPLPFSSQLDLSLGDCYFVLALIYDPDRRDGKGINLFQANDLEGQRFWEGQLTCLKGLRATDALTLDHCLDAVGKDLETLKSGPCRSRQPGTRGKGRRRRVGGSPRQLTSKQLEAFQVVGLHRGNISAAAKELNITRQALDKRYRVAQKKLARASTTAGPRVKTQKLPHGSRGEELVEQEED